nr:hypothetical protein Q903MT_gene331 [Picea sitchensis]
MKGLPASLVVQVRVPGKNLNPSNNKLNAGHSCPSQSNINIYLHSLWAFNLKRLRRVVELAKHSYAHGSIESFIKGKLATTERNTGAGIRYANKRYSYGRMDSSDQLARAWDRFQRTSRRGQFSVLAILGP